MTQHVLAAAGWLNEGVDGFFLWIKNLGVKLQAAKAARETVKELSALSDAELSDIGIPRGEIRHLAQQHYEEIVNKNLKGWV